MHFFSHSFQIKGILCPFILNCLREIKSVPPGNAIEQNIKWERSEKHLFWMLGGVKWSPVGRTFDSGVTSIQIFEVERNGFVL